jgi:FkbM family methyltransferase
MLTTPQGALFHVRPFAQDCYTVFCYWADAKAGFRFGDYTASDNDVILDVGAHIGAVSVRAAAAAQNVTVYALEPFPTNFDLLKRNIRTNGLGRAIFPHQVAVGAVSGDRDLFTCSERADGHTFYAHERFRFGEPIRVRCVRLTDFLSGEGIDTVNFLKIDAEGAEYDIFLEGDTSFLDNVECVGMEYHEWWPQRRAADIVRVLEHKGFSVTAKDGDLFADRGR